MASETVDGQARGGTCHPGQPDTGERQLQALALRLLTRQEQERRAIVRGLHSGAGQALAAIMMAASVARDEPDPERRAADLDEITAQATAALDQLRDISNRLRPPPLDALGLAAALRWYAGQAFPGDALEVRMELQEPPRRPPLEVEQACFRTAQEALDNVLQHAHAGVVVVSLQVDDAHLELGISDDGRGFDPAADHGPGLTAMREYARALGGTLSVDAAPGHGTRIRLRAPWR